MTTKTLETPIEAPVKKDQRELQKEEVLAWVNEERFGFSLTPLDRLLPGERAVVDNCVIAKSLGNNSRVRSTQWTIDNWKTSNNMPIFVQSFINKFDDGCLPELDIGLRKQGT